MCSQKFFCCSILHLNRKKVQTLTKVSNKIQLIKRLRQKLSFFSWRKLSTEEVKEPGVLFLWNSKKKKNTHLTSCQVCKKLSLAPPSSVYSKSLFSEAGNLYEQKRNRLLQIIGKKLLFLHHNLKKQKYFFFSLIALIWENVIY